MSIITADNFEIYGGDIDKLVEGLWAQIGSPFGVGIADTALAIPPFETEGKYWLSLHGRGAAVRRVYGGSYSSIGHCFNVYFDELPSLNNRLYPIEFRDGSNTMTAQMRVTTDGNLTIHDSTGTEVASTTAPAVVSGTVHKIQIQLVYHASAATVEVRVDGVTVINATGLAIVGTASQWAHWINNTSSGPYGTMYIGYTVAYSLAGTYNSDWPAISGVALLEPNADTAANYFTPRPYQLFGAGNLAVPGSGSVLDCSSSVDFDLAAADYTLEGWVRFDTLPTGTQFATLMGKWSASTSERSYRLVKYGPSSNGGHLRFEITTDGTLATLTPVIDVAWTPTIGHWYYIAVCRASGVTRLFIDGEVYGVPVADANTYFAATAKFVIGGEMSGVGSTVLTDSSMNGHVDEVRITPGVARYTANFTKPTTAFPTNVAGDPDFASVVLLLDFDENTDDLSDFATVTVARGSCARQEWSDAAALYLTVDSPTPYDTRFMEAAFLPAVGVLTFDDLPTASETITLGATTYTFVSSLTGADDVLIGATADATLDNLLNAINNGPGEGTVYGSGTTQNLSALATNGPAVNQLTAAAIVAGAAGNSIVSTSTAVDVVWEAATLGGGADIPSPTEFTLTPLPPEATGLRALILLDRSYVDTDNASLQKSFVVSGTAAAGADNALTTSPTYRYDVVEEDPDTTAALTPTSVVNGRIRMTRTA